MFQFATKVNNRFGIFNSKIKIALTVSAILSIPAVLGFFFPALMATLLGVFSLIIGGGVFVGTALLFGLNPASVFLGLIAGGLSAYITNTIDYLLIPVPPAIFVILLAPTLISFGASALGGVFYLAERIANKISPPENENQPANEPPIANAPAQEPNQKIHPPIHQGSLFSISLNIDAVRQSVESKLGL